MEDHIQWGVFQDRKPMIESEKENEEEELQSEIRGGKPWKRRR